MSYFDEASEIWRTFVPPAGQATTVQGELLRAVEKLRDEAIRNGNGNWDDGFETLLTYLQRHLFDESVYPTEVLTETRTILAGLRGEGDLWLQDEPYDFLADRVVDYYRHHGSRPHQIDPSLHR